MPSNNVNNAEQETEITELSRVGFVLAFWQNALRLW
jgi:hypothetical protein